MMHIVPEERKERKRMGEEEVGEEKVGEGETYVAERGTHNSFWHYFYKMNICG